MTNEEKAREIAECCSVMPPTQITQSDVLAMTNNAAMQAMEWKDKERKELWRITRNHYQEWAEERERQLIDNLREVLSAHMHGGEIDEVLAELDEKMKGE